MVRGARVRCSDGEVALSKDESSRSSLLTSLCDNMECDDVCVPFSKSIVEQVFQDATDVLHVAQARLYFDVVPKSYHDVVLALRDLPMPIAVPQSLELRSFNAPLIYEDDFYILYNTLWKPATMEVLDALQIANDAILLVADSLVRRSRYVLPPYAIAWLVDRVRQGGKYMELWSPIHVNDLFVSLFALDPGFLLCMKHTDHISVLGKLEKRGVLMDERALARAVQNNLPIGVVHWIAKRCVARPWIDASLSEDVLVTVRARRDVYLARAHLSVDLAGEVEKWIRETY